MPPRTHASRRRPLALARRTLPALAAALLATACGGGGGGQSGAPEPRPPRPATSVAPMDLGGQKVLILPVQATAGLNTTRDALTAEIVFALTERDTRTGWIPPERLRSALRRSPGFAADPGALPQDPYIHHGERYVQGALALLLRRYSALMDARLVLVPRSAAFIASPDSAGGFVRMNAAMLDARTGNVLWYGEADGETRPRADEAATATAAAALATRLVIPSQP